MTSYVALLLFLAVLPVIIILFFVYFRDKNKEPIPLLIILFFSGFISAALVLIISEIMGKFLPFMNINRVDTTFVDILLYAFIGVALVEEFSKGIMTYIVGYHHKEFDETYDGMVYAIFVSLGFAFLENILYVINTSSVNTALLRAVSAVPSHACDAIFMGYYLSIAKQFSIRGKHKLEKRNLILGLLVPTVIHGIYDFCLLYGQPILMTIFVAFVIFLFITSNKKLKALSIQNKKIKFKNKFCHVCGKAVTGEFCAKCGTKQI